MHFKKCISRFCIYEGLPVVEFKEFREARQHGSVRRRCINCISLSESSCPFSEPCKRTFESVCDGIGCDLFPKAYSDFCMARDRQVVETGIPIVNQRYSKVANLSKSLNILSIYPLRDSDGTVIGTLCAYHRGVPEHTGPV